jgi:diguanylate cyclase (GGDEF)-like protein
LEAGGARPKLLVVDDEPMNLDLFERAFHRRYDVVTATGAEQALAILQQNGNPDSRVDVIVSDYRMPGMNGSQFLAESIRWNPSAKRVLISGYSDIDGLIGAINDGQVHYFVRKPWNPQDLERTIEQLLRVHRLERENRELVEELRHANERLEVKQTLLARSLDDRGVELASANTELERANRELAILAFRDGLTGLYNHRTFHERLREEIARARRYTKAVSLVFCDLDHFKSLNDQYGHPLGDDVLRRTAELLRGGAGHAHGSREFDVIARYGGEEFVLLLPETAKQGAKLKAERLLAEVRAAAFPGGRRVTMSFGVASYPEDARSSEELLAFADHALWVAKQAGRDQVQVYGEGAAAPGATGARPGPGPNGAVPSEAGVWESSGRVPADAQDFPTYHERILSVVGALERERALGCLYVDLSRLRRVELEYGVARHNELLLRVGKMLLELRGERMRKTDLLCRADSGDAFVYFLSAARSRAEQPPEELEGVAQRVQEHLEANLQREVYDLIHDAPRVAVGYARVLHNPMMRAERMVGKLVDESKESSALMRRRQAQRDKDLLQEIILEDGLTPVYQPIVHLDSGDVFGFEALTRGPRRSPLEAPIALFSVAEEVNLLFELDRACFRNALRGAVGLEPVHRLFVNLLPMSFYDASFIENEVQALLEGANLTPANVVFEITERLAIENFASFKRALSVFTNLGFGVAVDDVGTKHSNLEAVMALRPHFVKLSDVLTRGAAKSTVKREMLRSLGRISEAIDAVMVAEGIETPDDLVVLKDLGVKYGQGYFLARPGAPFPKLRASVKRAVRALAAGSLRPIPAPPALELDEDDGEFHEPPSAAVPEATLSPRGGHGAADEFDDELTTGSGAGNVVTGTDGDGGDKSGGGNDGNDGGGGNGHERVH